MEFKLLEGLQKLTIFFCRDFGQDVHTIQGVLNTYKATYGQLINLDKSKIYFVLNVLDNSKILF